MVSDKKVKIKTIFRFRFNREIIETFINFITNEDYLQDVAYGTVKIKFDTQPTITVPHVVRTANIKTIINDYLDKGYLFETCI